jgi:creatinine amidohydrolase
MYAGGPMLLRLARNVLLLCLLAATLCSAQELSPKWEELTAADFVKALQASSGVCLLPFGIMEKHGPSGPLGTDLINVRAATLQAVKQQYAIVFPEYYFGQIAEARHQPGTVAYRSDLQLALLQATTDEMARNGCHKVLIVNGHGGNTALLQYFAQVQLDLSKDYVVYIYGGVGPRSGEPMPAAAAPSKPGVDGHAGEEEIAGIMANAPALAHPERAGSESGADQKRLVMPPGLSTGIYWYSSFPNHYAGDAAGATAARGSALQEVKAAGIARAIAFVKADTVAPRLQQEFFEKSGKPLDTKQ